MTKLELLDVLNNLIPADALFNEVKVDMLVSQADKQITYNYLHELRNASFMGDNAVVCIEDDLTTHDLTVRIVSREKHNAG